MIIEKRYTGIIDDTHKDETVMVSITSRRLLYLTKFAEGQNLCGVLEAITVHLETAKEMFVKPSESCSVDASYVYSLSPEFSEEATSKTVPEDSVIYHFQDFSDT